MLTTDERADLQRLLEASEIIAAAGPLGPITPAEAETYGLTPEEVGSWNAEEAAEAHSWAKVRLSLLQKVVALVDAPADLCTIGNLLGEPGHPHRELLVRAAYDLQVLANVADRRLPADAHAAIVETLERWRVR